MLNKPKADIGSSTDSGDESDNFNGGLSVFDTWNCSSVHHQGHKQ
jgi:hypothetical protein